MNLSPVSIIPQPLELNASDGVFKIEANTRVQSSVEGVEVAQYLTSLLHSGLGNTLPIEVAHGARTADKNMINLVLVEGENELGQEGYTLQVTPDYVEIRSAGVPGLFYGVQTLRQLLPESVEGLEATEATTLTVPAVEIKDRPRFRWRGLHLDVGRHMFPLAFVKKFIDLMALHKFNVFHWHLTEDQGWRLEIKAFPKLTEIGAWREETPIPANREQGDGKRYGGFYTQDEVREVVAYAKERFITVVPEIDVPGHTVAALAAYPELGCVGHGYKPWSKWGISEDVLCPGNEDTYAFLEKVFAELFELFPSEFIHIGGDECPKVRWRSCPKCQQKIKRESLENEHALQSYFIRRMEAFINANGRHLIGWDEILEGGLAPNATVMSWRGTKGGIEAAKAGHNVVMTPTTHCYFDYYQSRDQESEPPAIGGYLPLSKVYEFDPVEGIPAGKEHHVLGGQGNTWTEYIPTPSHVEYMAYPRAIALAESVWSEPDKRDYDSFLSRLKSHLRRLDALDVNYRDPFA